MKAEASSRKRVPRLTVRRGPSWSRFLAYVLVCVVCLLSACVKRPPDPAALELLHKAEEQMRRADGICNFVLVSVHEETELPPALETVEELETVLEKAALLLRQALEIDPRLHRARLYLATVYLRGGEPLKAIPSAEAYNRAQPEDEVGEAILCTAYVGAEKWDTLIEFCGSVLARGKSTDPAFLAQMTAVGWFYKGDLERSRKWATRVIEMDPKSTQGYFMLAAIQYVSGDEGGLGKTREVLRLLDPKAEGILDRMLESLEGKKNDLELLEPLQQELFSF